MKTKVSTNPYLEMKARYLQNETQIKLALQKRKYRSTTVMDSVASEGAGSSI